MLNYLPVPLTILIGRNPEMSIAECSYGCRVLPPSPIRGDAIGDGGEHEKPKIRHIFHFVCLSPFFFPLLLLFHSDLAVLGGNRSVHIYHEMNV